MKVTNLFKSIALASLVGASAMSYAISEGELSSQQGAVISAENMEMGEPGANRGRCETYKYTRYKSAKVGQEVTLTRFSSASISCNSYFFTIEKNYDGHDMELILYRGTDEIDSGTHIGRYLPRGNYTLTLRNNGGGTGTRGGVRYEYREN